MSLEQLNAAGDVTVAILDDSNRVQVTFRGPDGIAYSTEADDKETAADRIVEVADPVPLPVADPIQPVLEAVPPPVEEPVPEPVTDPFAEPAADPAPEPAPEDPATPTPEEAP